MNYQKQPISIEQQIALLKQRGLIIDDEPLALDRLKVISYFRLADYWRPMEADHTTHSFLPNTHFVDVLACYYFDKQLKMLLFSAVQTIEIAVRTAIIHHFSMQHGAFWFIDATLFTDQSLFASHLESLNRELQRSKEEFIKEHYQKYGKTEFPPAWKSLEVASLGSLSKLYENFASRATKNLVARDFCVRQSVFLASWLNCLTVLRNCIAHHSRLWNRRFSIMPQMPPLMPNTWIANNKLRPYKLYPMLCCIAYWLNAIDPTNTFAADFKALLARYPSVYPAAMGAPRGWDEEPLWE